MRGPAPPSTATGTSATGGLPVLRSYNCRHARATAVSASAPHGTRRHAGTRKTSARPSTAAPHTPPDAKGTARKPHTPRPHTPPLPSPSERLHTRSAGGRRHLGRQPLQHRRQVGHKRRPAGHLRAHAALEAAPAAPLARLVVRPLVVLEARPRALAEPPQRRLAPRHRRLRLGAAAEAQHRLPLARPLHRRHRPSAGKRRPQRRLLPPRRQPAHVHAAVELRRARRDLLDAQHGGADGARVCGGGTGGVEALRGHEAGRRDGGGRRAHRGCPSRSGRAPSSHPRRRSAASAAS